jgi:predicted nucleic acid-binding protein
MTAICDTGPLVALLNRNDPYHEWSVEVMRQVKPPMLVCEAVLTEAAYFLREDRLEVDPLFAMLERGALRLGFELERHWPRVRAFMKRYRQMDLADACVVVMSELFPRSTVLTVDRRDFSVYRRGDRRGIPFLAPGRR